MDESLALIRYEKLSTKEKMILYFFIYAFIGWCLETIYALMVFGYFVKRGFLFGPICPIYGFGAVLLITMLEKVKNKNNFIKFLVSMVAFSIFEFVASWILEIIFHQRWWDYSDAILNIQGRICITFSLLWGFIGVIFSNIIHPFVDKHINKLFYKIPFKLQKTSVYVLCIILLVDVVLSVIKYI